jgi:hypothetical protein
MVEPPDIVVVRSPQRFLDQFLTAFDRENRGYCIAADRDAIKVALAQILVRCGNNSGALQGGR